MMRHKHHIIPKHLGGSDDPSNIVELTPLEHADAHSLLYALHKNPFDKIAELGLLGFIGKEEIIRRQLSIAGTKGANKLNSILTSDDRKRNARINHKKNPHIQLLITAKAKDANGFKVEINGVSYKSLRDAEKATGICRKKIRNLYT